MSRFEQEWALVPAAAKVIAALTPLLLVMPMGLIWLVPPLSARDPVHPMLWGFFLLTTVIPSVLMVIFVLLVGYVWGDAGRRGMNQLGWTLLAALIPGAIGLILYFILREPLPLACPSCAAPVPKNQACCTSCGAKARHSCPQCHRPVEPHWSHCGHCGAAVAPVSAPQSP